MLSIERLEKAYGAGPRRVDAVRGIDLRVPGGGLFALLGPSGSGKTTVLRCVAGLERPDAGTITVAGQAVTDATRGVHLPPERRGLGMVFQAPTVWPHMTARENIAFPLLAGRRGSRRTRADVRRKVDATLALVRLDGLGDRPATDLSGGQQQRLALARAIAGEPRLLLLDEPLAALDDVLRVELRDELRRVHAELGVTTLYVTHDQGEALSLSTLVGVLRDGRIEQIGTPRDVYERPETAFVAALVGAANLLPGTVAGRDNGAVAVRTAHGVLQVPHDGRLTDGAAVLVVARPRHVKLVPGGTARVVSQTYLGDVIEHVVRAADSELRAWTRAHEALAPGAEVTVDLDHARLALVPPEAE